MKYVYSQFYKHIQEAAALAEAWAHDPVRDKIGLEGSSEGWRVRCILREEKHENEL